MSEETVKYYSETQEEFDRRMMKEAEAISVNSPCLKKKNGAILVSASGPMTTVMEWNDLKDRSLCTPEKCPRIGAEAGIWSEGQPVCDVIHAEVRLICASAECGVPMLNGTVYCTYQPCVNCATLVSLTGIKRLVYRDTYGQDKAKPAMDILKDAGIEVEQLDAQSAVDKDIDVKLLRRFECGIACLQHGECIKTDYDCEEDMPEGTCCGLCEKFDNCEYPCQDVVLKFEECTDLGKD